jgi:hypothetical protein
MKVNAALRLAITNLRGEGQDIPIGFAFPVKSSRRLGTRKYEDDHDYSRPEAPIQKSNAQTGSRLSRARKALEERQLT